MRLLYIAVLLITLAAMALSAPMEVQPSGIAGEGPEYYYEYYGCEYYYEDEEEYEDGPSADSH